VAFAVKYLWDTGCS